MFLKSLISPPFSHKPYAGLWMAGELFKRRGGAPTSQSTK
jgi:hypothetical protein